MSDCAHHWVPITVAESDEPLYEACAICGGQREFVKHSLILSSAGGSVLLTCPCGYRLLLGDQVDAEVIPKIIKSHMG